MGVIRQTVLVVGIGGVIDHVSRGVAKVVI
jgi:hypothetical protein